MPTRFELPTLSDKDYAQLQSELTAAIPKFSDNWTDFNYSDPGITLLQLLCWLGDATLYRIDTVPAALYLNFVRWIVGATGDQLEQLVDDLANDVVRQNGQIFYLEDAEIVLDPERLALARYLLAIEAGAPLDLAELRSRALGFWSASYRAVTPDDFARLAKQATRDVSAASPMYLTERVVVLTEPPYIRVIPVTGYVPSYSPYINVPYDNPGQPALLATIGGDFMPMCFAYQALAWGTGQYLAPRRLIGTALRVEAPVFIPLDLTVELAYTKDADPATVLNDAFATILALLSPVTGGEDGNGWPFGRDPTSADIVLALRNVAGIDHSQPVRAQVDNIRTFVVGRARVGDSTLFGVGPAAGLPVLWNATLQALTDTWTVQVGVHSRVGMDTRLPYPEGRA